MHPLLRVLAASSVTQALVLFLRTVVVACSPRGLSRLLLSVKQLRGPRASLKSLWLPSTVTIQLGSLPGRVPSLPSHVLPSPPWSPCCGRTGTLSAPQPWRAHAHLCVCCSLRLLFAWPRVAPTCHLARSQRLPTRPAPRDAPTALRSRRNVCPTLQEKHPQLGFHSRAGHCWGDSLALLCSFSVFLTNMQAV